MSLLALSCSIALQLNAPCATTLPSGALTSQTAAFKSAVLPDAELGQIHGQGLAYVGLDQAGSAARARYVDVTIEGQRGSDQLRELVDNWNLEVATPLIAQAAAAAQR